MRMGDILPNAREVVITGGSFQAIRIEYPGSTSEMALLLRHCALAALFNTNEPSDQPKCDPATRQAIIDDVMTWVATDDIEDYITSMLWLYGPAGAGKTALGKTIAALCSANGRLLGAFFFSRTMAGRGNGTALVPTLAYQLMLSLPSTREEILKNIKDDPAIFQKDLATQLERLIINPLNGFMCVAAYKTKEFVGLKQPRLFVIDGLDECSALDIQCKIVEAISKSMHKFHLPIRIMIASRPEAHIALVMDKSGAWRTHFKRINLAVDPHADRDIRTFLCSQFEEIRKMHPEAVSNAWPTSHDIDELVRKASGQFIYAKAVVDYVKTLDHAPDERLEIVLGLTPPPSNDSPFSHLDQLYHHIFSSARDREATMEIVRLLVIPRKRQLRFSTIFTSPAMIEDTLGLKRGEVRRRLITLLSLFTITDPESPIKILHTSLSDFLFDQSRSREFFINAVHAGSTVPQGYLQSISGLECTYSVPRALGNRHSTLHASANERAQASIFDAAAFTSMPRSVGGHAATCTSFCGSHS